MMMHFLDEIDAALRGEALPLPARRAGRARRLAALSRRRLQYQLLGQGLLCPEARRRQSGRAAHGTGARGHTAARRRRRGSTCSRALRWRCSGSCRGAACPTFPSKSCCCRDGSRSISTRWPTGRAPSWCRCSFCARASRSRKNPRDVHIRELFTTPPEKERDYFRAPGIRWPRRSSRPIGSAA